MERPKYQRAAATLFCVLAVIIFLYLLFEYALGIILPFGIAFCVGVPIYHLSVRAQKRTRLPRKLCAVLLVALFLSVLVILVFVALNRLFSELEELVEWLRSDTERLGHAVGRIFGYVEDISSHIPFIEEIENIDGLENLRQTIDRGVSDIIGDFVNKMTSALPAWAVKVIKYTPKVFITIIVSVLACFYFAVDYGRLRDGALGYFKGRGADKLSRALSSVGKALKRYARAYLVIMLLTFFEVFVGLLIIGKRYAFLLALIVAVVDVLPVFGAGTVLLPWAVVSLLMRDMRTGLGLLILYGVITIIRQIAEPRIVGGSLGIHPLVTLFSMFAGLSLFGVAGMLFAPAMVMVCKEIFKTD